MTLQRDFYEARNALEKADHALLKALTTIVPGLDYQELCSDPCDWDGISLELYGVTPVGLELSAEQQAAVYDLGFTAIRLYYEAPDGTAPRDGITDSMSGDWWATKSRGPKACAHSVRAQA